MAATSRAHAVITGASSGIGAGPTTVKVHVADLTDPAGLRSASSPAGQPPASAD